MGDAKAADAALIPTVHGPDDADWQMLTGEIDYAAEARLIHNTALHGNNAPGIMLSMIGLSATALNGRNLR